MAPNGERVWHHPVAGASGEFRVRRGQICGHCFVVRTARFTHCASRCRAIRIPGTSCGGSKLVRRRGRAPVPITPDGNAVTDERTKSMFKLYYAPGTCALATHIALEEAGAPYE